MASLKVGLNREGEFGKFELKFARCQTGGTILGAECVHGTKQSIACVESVLFNLVIKTQIVSSAIGQLCIFG